MKGVYSHAWLQTYFTDPLPSPEVVRDGLLRCSFEVEEVRVGVDGDSVYVLDVPPNRSVDCLAHYGIAKEISAIFSLTIRHLHTEHRFSFADTGTCIQTDACDRYTMLRVDGIDLPETPKDIRLRLEAVGQQCINPIVDLSNYLLFDVGQPIHVFDARKVSGNFSVRDAHDGETLVLLGGQSVVLSPEDVVIADGDRAVALAGVKGGEMAKVDSDTTDVYVEIATFDALRVRQTMRRVGCGSDAGVRFSQGFPAEVIDYTARRVADVFGEYGSVTHSFDHSRVPLSRGRKTGVSVGEVNALLGTAYSYERIAEVFDRLCFSYEYLDPRERFVASALEHVGKPYKWGASVSCDAPDAFDCSSFVSWCAAQAGVSVPRISVNQCLYALPVREPRVGDLFFAVSSEPDAVVRTERVFESGFPTVAGRVERGVSHVGIVLEDGKAVHARGVKGGNAVAVSDLADEEVVMYGRFFDDEKRFVVSVPVDRPDLRDGHDLIEEIGRLLGYDSVPAVVPVPGLIDKVAMRFRRDETVFSKRLSVLCALQKLGFSEIVTSTFCNKGLVSVAYPVAKDKGFLRSCLRDGMEAALVHNAYNGELLGLGEVRLAEIGSVFSDTGEEVRLALGVRKTLGRAGAVDFAGIARLVSAAVGVGCVFEDGVWEIPLDCVAVSDRLLPDSGVVEYVTPSKYPFVLRDVAVFVPAGVGSEQTADLLRRSGGRLLRTVNLFDTFEVDGKVSYAFRLVFQSDERTLDDGAVNTQMESVYAALRAGGYVVR